MLRESDIERSCGAIAKALGWLTYKFVSPSNRGVPDRVFIKEGRIVFVEFKAPYKKPTKLQASVIDKMRAAGCEVHVCDSVEAFRAALSI